MSTSYQDIDGRLKVIEDKVQFILDTLPLKRQERSLLDPERYVVIQLTLGDLYTELKREGSSLVMEHDNG